MSQASDQSDRETIAAILAGDSERYAELVDTHQTGAIQLAYSLLSNYEDARDAAQEAFVSAFHSLPRFKGSARFSSWLYRIVVNKAKDKLRKRQRTPYMVSVDNDDESAGVGPFTLPDLKSKAPAEIMHEKELATTISRAVQQLPFKQRTAFVLHHMQGKPLQECADVMGCRLGTVKTHVFRATQRLQALLAALYSERTLS
ncbi:MAG: sigma-70 family RNA polymerase sigma factor [Verrucomicrobia bacterium]|jgi:RNA polymerase sigma-70 factor, ECF subfamily|nr:sigma-70 family RNA polymerase sigma factor [Verrucomicrobiota bacterium]MBT7066506.1 sigma-70 family RNA polymerase sigma factor [Verrucomicrobiota bacterium]MBT7699946.1 sigma-70 family RNA polymerase sigma factor [Verrucomicrobiota bacterium]